MTTKFKLGQTVLAPYGRAEVLMIVGPKPSKEFTPAQENRYSILYENLYSNTRKRTAEDRVQEWRWESELREIAENVA